MSRRSIQVFNMSFLDLMTDALGAVILMFLIVPKGRSIADATAGRIPQVKDTAYMKLGLGDHSLWNVLPDTTVKKLKVGDTLLVIVKEYKQMPKGDDVAVVDPSDWRTGGKTIPEGQKLVDQNAQLVDPNKKQVDKDAQLVDPNKKQVDKDAQLVDPNKKQVDRDFKPGDKEIPPANIPTNVGAVPGAIAFQISWSDNTCDADIIVKRENAKVWGDRTSDSKIGRWTDSRKGLFSPTTTSETVYQDQFIEGTYEIYARFDERKDKKDTRDKLNVTCLLVNKKFPQQSQQFDKSIAYDKTTQGTFLARVTVKADGSFTGVSLNK